jgi:hypothetical protein
MEGHEKKAAEAEFELADMEAQSDGLAEDIEAAKGDWEQKKQDGGVPGARGEAGDEPSGEAVGEHDDGPDPEVTGGGPAGGGSPELED